jgi:hypothetical protein
VSVVACDQGESPGACAESVCGAAGGAAAAAARRPVLPAPELRLDPLEDEHSLHMLYDYTTVVAWSVYCCLRICTNIIKLNSLFV